MSNNELGDTTGPARTLTVEATQSIGAGDAIALDQSEGDDGHPQAAQLLDDTSPDVNQMFGIATEALDAGDNGTVVVEGPVIGNVATGVSQGERLNASATAGQLASEDDGPVRAVSNEGGIDRAGTDLPDNAAEVYV